LVLFAEARSLDALLLDELSATAVGVDVVAVRRRLILATSLLTGASVAVAGAVGFVGLVVPHTMRWLVGARHDRLLPACAAAGGAFLVLADIVARRAIAPEELRLGVVTAALGAPVFLLLLVRGRRLAEV
jgi:iron complex transport system permease protein